MAFHLSLLITFTKRFEERSSPDYAAIYPIEYAISGNHVFEGFFEHEKYCFVSNGFGH
jgi:hypothetical protein